MTGGEAHTAGALAALVEGEVVGEAGLLLRGVASLEDAEAGDLSFYTHPRYRQALLATRASAVLVPRDFAGPLDGRTAIRVDAPLLAFARLAQRFHPERRPEPGISERAAVHPGAQISPSATVMGLATVSRGAVVGARAVLYPGVFLGEGASVGEDTVLLPNVCVLDRCQVGARCRLHPGVVIGADGFGFVLDVAGPEHVKVPQVGVVRIEDDVEIGANSCVDRATSTVTVVGRGSKLDNLVQVGHNSTVGPYAILCAQVGLAGSTHLGQGVMLGGQAGTAGHQRLGDLVQVAAASGVVGDVAAGERVAGVPAIAHKNWLRSAAAYAKLPVVMQQLRALERRLAALEEEGRS
jgi:UDP-3-O-[3-hydroxymyristoyl] glucosamine N-acyltransferase